MLFKTVERIIDDEDEDEDEDTTNTTHTTHTTHNTNTTIVTAPGISKKKKNNNTTKRLRFGHVPVYLMRGGKGSFLCASALPVGKYLIGTTIFTVLIAPPNINKNRLLARKIKLDEKELKKKKKEMVRLIDCKTCA